MGVGYPVRFGGDIINDSKAMILGFDASHLDNIVWETISPDFEFCIIKKSEGATYTDPYYAYRSKYLPTSKLVWGDYHFMQPQDSIQSQLDNYFNERIANDLPPILDAEVDGITPDMVQQWLSAAKEKTGRKPILYCDPSFYKDNLKSTEFDCYYWIAAYQPEPPHIRWDIWQKSEYGTHQGGLTGGHLDIDVTNMTAEQLKAM